MRFWQPLCFAALAGMALLSPASGQEAAIPSLGSHVTDTAGLLTTDERVRLEQKLAAFEARKGSQVAVLTVLTTQPETIEQYSIRVAEKWKLGRQGVDDGVLLLVARNDRAVRIDAGYGLEGILTDLASKRIIEEIIVPRFKSGDFAGGIDAGVNAIISLLEGETLPEPQRGKSPESQPGQNLIMFGFLLVITVGGILRAVFGAVPAATLIGGLTALLAWTFLASLILAIFAGVVGFVLTLFGGGMPRIGGGGVWGAGRTGGGGWSGGGGGFGGGGASGRW